MWRNHFKVIGIVPGKVKTPKHGIIDLSSDNLGLETLRELVEQGFPYLEPINEVKEVLLPEQLVDHSVPDPVPAAVPDPVPAKIRRSSK